MTFDRESDSSRTIDARNTRAAKRGSGDDRSRPRHWVRVVGLVGAVVVPAIAAFVFVVALPAARLTRHGLEGSDPSHERPTTENPADSGILKTGGQIGFLRLDEAFWKARLVLAKQEPIALAVDLADSVASLDIRGVPVMNCKIHRIKITNAMPFLQNRNDFLARLSRPFILQSEMATLPKEPIRITEAPRDSIEANKAASRPLAPERADVYFTMFFEGNLALAVRQLEKPSHIGFWRNVLLRAGEKLKEAGKTVVSLSHSDLPPHELRIELTLAGDDAKAIYRALGPQAGLAIRF